MQLIRETVGQRLIWQKDGTKRNAYELRAGAQTLANLSFEKGLSGTLATAEAAETLLTFKRTGMWYPNVTVRLASSETEIANFEPRGWGSEGVLLMNQGQSFRWGNEGFWRPEYLWLQPDGTPLIRFHNRDEWNSVKGQLEIMPAAKNLTETPLLVTLGWYLIILGMRDSSNAAATVGSTAAVIAANG